MADDQKLKIGIEVTADTRGAQQAQQAVQSVTSGTKQATQATAEAGQRAEGAARAWEGLRMSAQGGLQSIVGLGKAASGALQAVVGAVPFAKWIMWATALVAIVGQLTGTFREWFSSTKEGAAAAQKPLQTVKEQLKELDRATTTKLRAQLNGITTAANEAAARIDALRTVSDALNDAQEAVALARIRANATMSPLEKLDAEQKVRETYRTARQEQAGQAIVDNSAASAREQLAYAESIATAAQATAAAQKIYDQLAADDEKARKARLGLATNELRGASREAAESGIAPQLSERYQQAAAEYEAAREAATKESIDAWKTEVENAKKAVDSRQTAQDEVTAKAAAAAESAKLAAIGLQAKFDALKATAEGERKVEKIDRAEENYKAQVERTKREQAALEDSVKPGYRPPVVTPPELFTIDQQTKQPGAYQTYAPREKAAGAGGASDAARALQDAAGAAQENTLDPQPLIDAAQQLQQSQQEAAGKNTEAIQGAASAISETAGQVPPPVDLSPVVAAQGEYHGAVMAAFADTKSQIAALNTRLNQQASQLRNLAARV